LAFVEIGGPRPATVVVIHEDGLDTPTQLADASFGSIRALALLALLYDPDPPLLTCIEEIDHGLHPYVFDRLMDRVREASDKTQFLIATHSPALVNRLSSAELIVCERGLDGASRIPAADPEQIREIERLADGDLGLGEIWFTGALGGVPA
jgi:predicted ATPase